MHAVERKFTVNGYQLVAREWHRECATKVIALHGWLDNAASFDILAPLLTDCHIVALDAPGHGLSDHKPPQATYNIWDDLLDILAVADALAWDRFSLLGHSRGAAISVLLAGAAPSRVETLLLLDGLLPQSTTHEDTAKQLRRFIEGNRALALKKKPVYASVDAAFATRVQVSSVSDENVRLIVERGLKPVDGGFTWRTDPRLLVASAFKMTDQHNKVLMDAVIAPVLLLLAEDGLGANQTILQTVQKYPAIKYYLLQGGHHFHLEQQSARLISQHITAFIRAANSEV